MALKLSEENLLLYPAAYNQKGLLGDFEVYVIDEETAFSLSGRRGPYTSIQEWFQFAGRDILGRDPECVQVALVPGWDKQGRLSGSSGDTLLLYKVSKDNAQKLEELADELEPTRAGFLII